LQVGAVLLFGFIMLTLAIYQAQGVPEENKQVEFEHSQAVADEMVAFYNAVFDTVVDGEPQSATITLGTSYNNRLFFIYPPPASGTLQTTEGNQLRLHNVTAVTDTNQSFDNYWNNETRRYRTQAITYQPNYRELRGAADYRIEYGMLAAQYPEVTRLRLAESHQPIIDGTEIEIVTVDGELQSVDTDAESVIPERVTESTTITVENDSNTGPITLELPTGLAEENWNTSNPDSVLYGEDNVENVSVDGGIAEIRFNGTKEYELTLHKVDIGTSASKPEPTYLRNVSLDADDLTFQVRDEFNDQVDESVDVWVFNATDVRREVPVAGERTVTLIDDECGVSLGENVGGTAAYERINVTGRC
jgi:hypothetical protein